VAKQPWVVTPERSSHRQLVLQLFAERGSELSPAIEADNESVINNIVESGVGVSLVRDEIARLSVDAGRAMIWPGATIETRLWLVHDAARRADPLIVAILDILGELWHGPGQVSMEKAA